MTQIDLLSATPRAAALRLAVPAARYFLPQPRDWHLSGPGVTRSGTTDRAVLVLHDLPPATPLRIEIAGLGGLDFTTQACAGVHVLADAAEAQAALDALADGGTLIVPAGDWVVTPLLIPSHRHLYLAKGARLMAPSDRDAFPILPPEDGGNWEGLPDRCYRAILTAINATEITIAGPGLVDGGGARGDWWDWPKGTRNGARRARLLHLVGCSDVTVLGPTLTNSPSWTVHPCRSRNLAFLGLTIENPPDSPNTDALNPESCQSVVIEGVHFSTGDDCIAIKAGKRSDDGGGAHLSPTSDIRIRHCLMAAGHGGVVIGSEMSGDVRDVHISQCEMIGTDRGLRIKSRRGRGGVVENIHMSDVDFADVGTVLAINMHYFCDHDGHSEMVQSRKAAPVTALTPKISNVTMDRIIAHDVRIAFAACLGLPESPVTGLRIGQVDLGFATGITPDVPLMADGLLPVAGAGLLVAHCDMHSLAGLPQSPLPQKDLAPC